MQKVITSVMLIAAAATAFNSCTSDLDSNEAAADKKGYSLNIEASAVDTRTDRDETTGKLSWRSTDQIGLFFNTDVNINAATSEELCADNTFVASGLTATSGDMYAYYPYNTFASQSTSATDLWLSLASSQEQSVAGEFNAGDYFTMVAGPVTIADIATAAKPKFTFSPLASVICFDIYDTVGKYGTEKVQSVMFTSDNTLVGGYKYNMVEGTFDMTSSLARKSAIVNMTTPFAVGDGGKVYMAVLPASHTGRVYVYTDCGVHTFDFTTALVCDKAKMGTVKLNLGNANAKHYVMYEPFDLMIWGGDYMHNIDGGRVPVTDGTYGQPATAAFMGEEPFAYAAKDVKGGDGTADFNTMSATYKRNRHIEGWTFSKAYERPGYIKLGTGSVGWNLVMPRLAGLSDEGETIKVTITAAHTSSADAAVTLQVQGAGLIDATDTEKDFEVPYYTGGITNVVANTVTKSITIYGATSATVLRIYPVGTNVKTTRTYIDDIIVERVAAATTPLLIPQNLAADATATSATISWNAVDDAATYSYTCKQGETEVKSGTTDQLSVEITGLAQSTEYTFSVTAQPATSDAAHTASAAASFEFNTTSSVQDTHASGYVFFSDNFDWLDASFSTDPNWTNGFVDAGCRPEDIASWSDELKAIWDAHGYTGLGGGESRVYANYGCLKIGRSYKAAAEFAGSFNLPDEPLADVTDQAAINVVITIDLAMSVIDDNGICYIEATTGTDVQTAKIQMKPTITDIKQWKTFTAEFTNLTNATEFRIYTLDEGTSKASRVYFDNISIAKK